MASIWPQLLFGTLRVNENIDDDISYWQGIQNLKEKKQDRNGPFKLPVDTENFILLGKKEKKRSLTM